MMGGNQTAINKSVYVFDIIFEKFIQDDYNRIMAAFINHIFLDEFIVKEVKSKTLKDTKRRYRCYVKFAKPMLLSFPIGENYRIYMTKESYPTQKTEELGKNDDNIIFNHEPGIDTDVKFYCYAGIKGAPKGNALIVYMF